MQSLDDWERRLKARLREVQLIGELALTEDETRTLGEQLGLALGGAYGKVHDLSAWVRRWYPATFVTYLVCEGVHSYEAGDYWSAVFERLHLSRRAYQELGEALEASLDELRLRRDFAGQRFVGTIIGHGGIPQRCLSDFFAHLLQPSVTSPDLARLAAHDLVQRWRLLSAPVGKPVQRFLEQGGEIAEEFVEGCREMARAYLDNGRLPAAADISLPTAVVAAYGDWLDTQGEGGARAPVGPRLRRPRLFLEPEARQFVHLVLPEQSLVAPPGDSIGWELGATLPYDKKRVHVRRLGAESRTEEAPHVVPGPGRNYCVRLMVGGQCQREWRYDIAATPTSPLLAFDDRTGALCSHQGVLPAAPLLLLLPPGVKLDDESLIRATFRRPPDEWSAWTLYAVDLSEAPSLALRQPDGQVVTVPVVATRAVEPVGGDPLRLGEGDETVYRALPPRLRLPRGLADDLDRWQLEIRPAPAAEPPRRLKLSLAHLGTAVRRAGDSVEISLAHPSLLGPAPFGQYRVRLRGPLGLDDEFHLTCAPHLDVAGHDDLHLPDADGAHPAPLMVETDDATELVPQADAGLTVAPGVTLAGRRVYDVSAPAEMAEAALCLRREVAPGRTVELPLRIPLRRLRWALLLDSAVPTWASQPLTVNLEKLAQTEAPLLRVDLPVDRPVRASLVFADSGGLELPASTSRYQPRSQSFDLRTAFTTLQQSGYAEQEAALVVQGLPGLARLRLPVLRVHRDVHVDQFSVDVSDGPDGYHFHLEWTPEERLRGRCLRLWPVCRPWEVPHSVPIPDDARSSCSLAVAADALPPGDYQAEFTVDKHVMAPLEWAPPAESAGHTARVRVGRLAERIAQLTRLIESPTPPFAALAERGLLHGALGDSAARQQDLMAACRQVVEAPLTQALGLLEVAGDEPGCKAMWPRVLRRVAEAQAAYQDGSLSARHYTRFWAEMKANRLSPLNFQGSVEFLASLLDAPDVAIGLVAARKLVEKAEAEGVRFLLASVERGKLETQYVLPCLEANLAASVRLLLAEGTAPARELVAALERRHPDALPPPIRPGDWVRCGAGWAYITRIEAASGAGVGEVHPYELGRGWRFHATLRPGHDAEPVVIEAPSGAVHFERPTDIYVCQNLLCQGFAASTLQTVAQHWVKAHGNGGLHYKRVPCVHPKNELKFDSRRPSDIWN